MHNETVWGPGNFSQTNSSGYINYVFNATCNYKPGVREWNGGTVDNYYQESNYTVNLVLHVLGDLDNTIIEPTSAQGTSSQYLRGSNITLRVKLTDLCDNNMTGYASNISLNMTSVYTSQTFQCTDIIEEGNGIYNCTFNTSTNPGPMPAGGYNLEFLTNKQYYNYNVREKLEQSAAPGDSEFSAIDSRNKVWLNIRNDDIVSVPDKWKNPWYS